MHSLGSAETSSTKSSKSREPLAALEQNWADEVLARYARALSHPIRIKILRKIIHLTDCLFSEFYNQFPLAQSTLSQHLKVLRLSGLIEGSIAGTSTRFRLNPRAMRELKVLVAGL